MPNREQRRRQSSQTQGDQPRHDAEKPGHHWPPGTAWREASHRRERRGAGRSGRPQTPEAALADLQDLAVKPLRRQIGLVRAQALIAKLDGPLLEQAARL